MPWYMLYAIYGHIVDRMIEEKRFEESRVLNSATNDRNGGMQATNGGGLAVGSGGSTFQMPSTAVVNTGIQQTREDKLPQVEVEVDDMPDGGEKKRETLKYINYCGIITALLFKVATIGGYFLVEVWPSKAKTLKLMVVIILTALDFWLHKNVTGRLLTSMIWRRKEHTSQKYVFICSVDESKTHRINVIVMYGSLITMVLFWGILFLYNLLTFSFEFCANIIPVLTNSVNFIAFLKCSDYQKQRAKKYGTQLLNSIVVGTGIDRATVIKALEKNTR